MLSSKKLQKIDYEDKVLQTSRLNAIFTSEKENQFTFKPNL